MQEPSSRTGSGLSVEKHDRLAWDHEPIEHVFECAAPLIRGLFAWDLHHDQGLSKAQACRVTAEKRPGMGTTPRSVNNALISVGEKINGYQPEQLPWIFQRFGD
jgi:hypothetical protein